METEGSGRPPDLDALADRYYPPGDVTRKHITYLKEYERLFAAMPGAPIRILELGVHTGASLMMWRDYLPQAIIVGIDIEPMPTLLEGQDRIHFIQASQDDEAALVKAVALAGGMFDIIVDDASHIGYLTKRSFTFLFPRWLRPGGTYAIEDFGTAFITEYPDGSLFVPPPTEDATAGARFFASHQYGLAGVVKQLIDHMVQELSTGTPSKLPVGRITIISNLALIERLAEPEEPAAPRAAQPARDADDWRQYPLEALIQKVDFLMTETRALRDCVIRQQEILNTPPPPPPPPPHPLRRLFRWR